MLRIRQTWRPSSDYHAGVRIRERSQCSMTEGWMASFNRPRELSTRSVVLSHDNDTFLVDKYRRPGYRKIQLIRRCVYYDAPLGRTLKHL